METWQQRKPHLQHSSVLGKEITEGLEHRIAFSEEWSKSHSLWVKEQPYHQCKKPFSELKHPPNTGGPTRTCSGTRGASAHPHLCSSTHCYCRRNRVSTSVYISSPQCWCRLQQHEGYCLCPKPILTVQVGAG